MPIRLVMRQSIPAVLTLSLIPRSPLAFHAYIQSVVWLSWTRNLNTAKQDCGNLQKKKSASRLARLARIKKSFLKLVWYDIQCMKCYLPQPLTLLDIIYYCSLICIMWFCLDYLVMLIFLYFHMIRMASIPVKTSIGCMEFGRQCSEDQVWTETPYLLENFCQRRNPGSWLTLTPKNGKIQQNMSILHVFVKINILQN